MLPDFGLAEKMKAVVEKIEFRAFIKGNVENSREVFQEDKQGTSFLELVFLFAVVPGVLVIIEGVVRSDFWVFAEINRAYFRFPLTADSFLSLPVLWKAFISSYGHNSLHPHLTGTVMMYYVSMAGIYPLSIVSGKKREFYILTGYCLFAVPFIVSYFSWLNPMGRTSIGFSSVDAAFLGILPVLLLASVRERTGIEFVALWSTGPMFLILAGLAFIAGSSGAIVALSTGMAAALILVTVLSVGLDDLLEGLHVMTWPSYVFNWWGVVAAVAGPYFLFFQISPSTNVVGHLGGYLAGYLFVVFLLWETPDFSSGFFHRVVDD